MGELGAKVAVLLAFLDAVIPCLTSSQRYEISQSFRQGVESILSLTDDLHLSGDYHSALLAITNAILSDLA